MSDSGSLAFLTASSVRKEKRPRVGLCRSLGKRVCVEREEKGIFQVMSLKRILGYPPRLVQRKGR